MKSEKQRTTATKIFKADFFRSLCATLIYALPAAGLFSGGGQVTKREGHNHNKWACVNETETYSHPR